MKIFTLLMLIISSNVISCYGQNSTDELIDSRVVHKYIHFNLYNGKLYYELDQNTDKKSHKELKSNLCITTPKRYDQINLVFGFINPFRQKIIVSETTEEDANYQALVKFYEVISGLNAQVSGTSVSPTEKQANTSQKAAMEGGIASTIATQARTTMAKLTAPSLIQWKYFMLQLPPNDTCIKDRKFFDELQKTDRIFYRKEDDPNLHELFPVRVNYIISALSKPENVSSLNNFNNKLKQDSIPKLEGIITSSDKQLAALKSWNYDVTYKKCELLKEYTKSVVDNFISEATVLQNQRKEVLEYLKKISKTMTDFLNECDSLDNTMIVGRVDIDVEKVKIAEFKLRDSKIQIDNNEIKIVEDATKDLVLGKLRVRNYHFFIPEFAIGGFYTDLQYPKYGTRIEDGKIMVSDAVYDHYSFVAAAHLNLVVNMHGIVNPMLQFGVGTAKQLPSFLMGTGIRFSKPHHLAISFGGLWTWRRELNTLKVNQVIENTAELESDLKHTFHSKPAFYLGLNYGF